MLFPEIEKLPPRRRMARFLEVAFKHRRKTPEDLANHLGYSRDTMVKQWMRGSAKVPLNQISSISMFFEIDVADILPCWLAQEVPDDELMMLTAGRILGVWEMLLVHAARDVYGADE